MRRFIIIGAALAVVTGATVAYAATLNNYTASISFSSSKPGTPQKPVAIGYNEVLGANNATAGLVAAPLVDIKTTIYGLVSHINKFKTCSFTTIDTGPKFNTGCPKGSEVATGTVDAEIGGPDLSDSKAISCKPDLAIYAAGGNKEWFFFTVPSPTACGGLPTGSTQPYPGTVSQSGKNMVIDVPLPSFVSTMVAHHANLYGSLTKETLSVKSLTTKVGGKTYPAQASVACKGGKRPWSVSFTAVQTAASPKVTVTKTGSSKC